MAKCTKHKHSSDESAIKCWGKTIGKRADRRLSTLGLLSVTKYERVNHRPPKQVILSGITVYYFTTAKAKLEPT